MSADAARLVAEGRDVATQILKVFGPNAWTYARMTAVLVRLADALEAAEARAEKAERERDELTRETEDALRGMADERSAALAERDALAARLSEAQELILAAYFSGCREGWEPGPCTSETMERLADYLANEDIDPSADPPQARDPRPGWPVRPSRDALAAELRAAKDKAMRYDAMVDCCGVPDCCQREIDSRAARACEPSPQAKTVILDPDLGRMTMTFGTPLVCPWCAPHPEHEGACMAHANRPDSGFACGCPGHAEGRAREMSLIRI